MQAPFSNNTSDDSTQEYNQMVNTEIKLIIIFVVEDGEDVYSQQKKKKKKKKHNLEPTLAQIMSSLLQNSDLN